jgi:hypothetical protein
MWEDSSYCWVVTCKNHLYHIPRNFIYRRKIPLAETDGVASQKIRKKFVSVNLPLVLATLALAIPDLCTALFSEKMPLQQQHSTETKADSSQNAGPFELSDERWEQFLKLLSAQAAPRDTIRIGCTNDSSCVAAAKFLLLFREAGWQVEDNKVFRIQPEEVPITGVEIVTYAPANERIGRWHLIDESHKTIYYAFRSIDVQTCGSRDDSLKQGTLGIYFGSETRLIFPRTSPRR